ncbi:MAG: cytochrome d ubiquinol oxidase subunit II, partial [Chlamydiales bacterium]|nr:cytochrome d ubiquinol oxidase subunit II [Chlamydiales bacterium]
MDGLSFSLLWYLVIGISVIFYVILDGFDLGVGILHCFTKKDEDRRIFLNAIGPFWDGNEVWLVIVGGALFAGFPDVYAALFSGF